MDNRTSKTPKKPALLEVQAENLPTELRDSPKWVLWRLEHNGKKWTKKPTNPRTKKDVDHQSELARLSLGDAFSAYQSGQCDGIGYSLGSIQDADGIVFIDLDGCVRNGKIEQWAQDIVDSFPPCWAEFSPSGSGLHLLVRGKIPRALKVSKDHVGIEIYGWGRYFAVSGNLATFSVDCIPDAQTALDKLYQLHEEKPENKPESNNSNHDDDFYYISQCLESGFLDSELEEYDRWLRVGMALHHRFSDSGIELWEQWSDKHERHITDECYQKARSFKRGDGQIIRFGSLVKIIRDNGGPEPPRNTTDDRRRKIQVVDGEVESIASDCLEELAKHPAIFKRHGRLVEVVPTPGEVYPWRLAEIKSGRLASLLTGIIWLYKLRKVGQGNNAQLIEVATNPPAILLDAILENPDLPGVRILNDVATFPYFAPDGRLVTKEGYDAAAGVLKISNSEIEVTPPKGNTPLGTLRAAVETIEKCFSVFHFDENLKAGSIWTAAAGIMTLQARRMIPIRPAILVISENRGSGKTQVCEQIFRCGTGESRPVPTHMRSGQQLLTDLFSAAGTGRNYIYYDNLKDGSTFGDPVLDGIITSGRIQDRIFGKNNLVESRNSDFLIIANGNNVAVADDMTRRCLLIKLKTQETKQYTKSYSTIMKEQAADVAAACMTILQYYLDNGCPGIDAGMLEKPLADDEGFTAWAALIRNCIYHFTYQFSAFGGVDVLATQEELRNLDSKAEATDALLTGIYHYLDGRPQKEFRTLDLASDLARHPVPENAQRLAGFFSGSRNLNYSIGIALRSRKGHTVLIEDSFSGQSTKFRLVSKTGGSNKSFWRLEESE